MKKFTALLTTFLISFSMMVPMASADPLVAADHVPGTRPAGLTSSQYGIFTGRTDSNAHPPKVENTTIDGKTVVTLEWLNTTQFGWKPDGVYTPVSEWQSAQKADLQGKSYVFHAKAKMLSGGPKTLGVGIGAYVMDQGEQSYHTQTVGTDWTDVKATLKMPNTFPTSNANKDNLSFGFVPSDTPAVGDKFAIINAINITSTPHNFDSENYYLAEEVAYDIKAEITSGSAVIPQGAEASLQAKAAIVNQIGLEGYVNNGGFTWQALNADKTAEATGITVTPSTDTKTASIAVADTVPAGKYNIVVTSTATGTANGWVKTIPITVQNVAASTPSTTLPTTYHSAHSDGTNDFNFIKYAWGSSTDTTAYQGDFTAVSTSNELSIEWNGGTKSLNFRPAGAYAAIRTPEGARLANGEGLKDGETPRPNAQNKTFVTKFKIKAEKSMTLGVGFGTYGNKNSLVDEPDSWASWTVSNTDAYQDYAAVLKTSSNVPNYENLMVGFLETPTGSNNKFWLSNKPADFYFAEEALWDIGHTVTSGSTTMGVGETLAVSAELLNQVGLPYSKGNGSFNWLVLDESGALADDVSLTTSGNTASFTASEAGTYQLVAVSATDSNLVEVIPVTVSAATGVTALTLSQSAGTASLAATVKGSESVYFVLAAYNGTALVDCKLVPVTATAGTASVTAEDCKLEGLTEGTTVKAFVWTNGLQPIAENGSFEKELTISIQ